MCSVCSQTTRLNKFHSKFHSILNDFQSNCNFGLTCAKSTLPWANSLVLNSLHAIAISSQWDNERKSHLNCSTEYLLHLIGPLYIPISFSQWWNKRLCFSVSSFRPVLSFNQKKVWIKYNCYFMFSFKCDELKDANSKNENRSFSLCTSFYFPSFQAIKIWSSILQ